MNIVTKVDEWRAVRTSLATQKIGFIPTMGNLHAGHLSLCQLAQQENHVTVVSIFINPTQFNQAHDFAGYPRTLEKDIELLSAQQIDYLFAPDATEIYPDQFQIQVDETEFSHELEGEYRPGHFKGMLTVVIKLLNLMNPHRAYFGEKDYQQFLLVKKMAAALFLSTEMISGRTIRAEDGLALSSRNSRLTAEQRKKAADFPRLLSSALSCEKIAEELTKLGFVVDYIAEKWQRRLGAVWLDEVRLIDNFLL